ncbi:TonB-dependent receptor (plasmid) [Pseudomonas silvicola]|nr:TonB-dependent receptor [Pseudomonas silvicola]
MGDLSANYSYDKAEIVDDGVNSANNGNRLQNAPRHSGALYLSHNLSINGIPGDFRVGGGARYVGSRAGDPENSFTMPDYVVADSFIAWNNQLFGEKTQQAESEQPIQQALLPPAAAICACVR